MYCEQVNVGSKVLFCRLVLKKLPLNRTLDEDAR